MLGPVLVWLFQEPNRGGLLTLSFSFMKETVSRMLTGLIMYSISPRKKVTHDCQKPSDMLIGYVIISLEHYLDSVFFFFFKTVMVCIPSYLFQLLCPFCHIQGHHKICCCSCLWKDGCTHWISMFDIHSYKIVTAVQAGKTLMIKSVHHLSIFQVPHTIWGVCGNWGSQILGN